MVRERRAQSLEVAPVPDAPDALVVEKGTVDVYRMFDVAREINLQRVVELTTQAATRLKLSRERSQYLELPNPPVALLLGQRTLALRHGSATAEVVARLFGHGAISILFRIPVEPGTRLGHIAEVNDDVFDNPTLEQVARAEAEAVCKTIAPALEQPRTWEGAESYHVVFVERFRSTPLAEHILERENLARLLVGETSPKHLSKDERADITKNAFSYFVDDLAVVDWNCAFVYEPSGSRDIPDILEIASAQLLELRYYDSLLDHELARIYDEMDRKRGRVLDLVRSDYGALRRKVMVLMLEVAECTERVENSLKTIGDFYLARVYRAALRRLRIATWQASVDRKEALVAQVYGILNNEVHHGRSLMADTAIVLLIVLDIVVALAKLY